MTNVKTQPVEQKGRPAKWTRPQLQPWLDGLSHQRRAEDDDEMQGLIAAAEATPVGRAAMDWARAHDIAFVIDHRTTAGGYYLNRTGIVAVSRRSPNNYAVGTLVHEIRHAWQDHHGLLPSFPKRLLRGDDFRRRVMRQALFEADADAYGQLTREQYMGARGHTERRLRAHFEMWYGRHNQFYFSAQRDFHAAAFGFEGYTAPNYQTEIKGLPALRVQPAWADPLHPLYLEKLGRGFAGGNYLAGIDRDALFRRYLSGSDAQRGFADAGAPIRPTVNQIRKIQLREHLKRPQPRYPLPGGAL